MKIRNYVFKIVQDHTPESPRYHYNLGLMICAHRSLNLGDEQSTDPIDLCAYATKEENFLGWVFDAFIHSHETCPELLKEWYLWDDNMGQAFFCKNDDKNDTGIHYLDDFLPKSFIKAIEDWMEDNLAILPLYLYQHTGISMNTVGFGCSWDSGQVGYIYATKEDYEKDWDKPFNREHAEECLKGEVETYDNYLTGEVYGKILYRIDDEDFDPTHKVSLTEAKPAYNLYEADDEFDETFYQEVQELHACWGYYGSDYVKECCLQEFPDMCLSDVKQNVRSELRYC